MRHIPWMTIGIVLLFLVCVGYLIMYCDGSKATAAGRVQVVGPMEYREVE